MPPKAQPVALQLTELHPKQLEIAHDPAKYKVVCAGRRAGKSKFACSHVTYHALTTQAPYWWVAPTFRNTQAAWRELTELAKQIPKIRIYKDEFLIEFPKLDTARQSAGFVQVVSAADPDNMRSAGLAGVVYDEAAYGQERVWNEVLLPALLDYEKYGYGWAMLISTPNGYNWFHRLYSKGERGEDGYKAFRFTSYDNPHLGATPETVKANVDKLRAVMTEQGFKQEILAEFIDDALGVFRGINACIYHDPPREPQGGHDYVMGVDWGRAHDYTAISVWDSTERREVYLDKFNQVGWQLQRGRVAQIAADWNVGFIKVEDNGIGAANVEELQMEGLPIYAVRMTNQEKKRLVEKLSLGIERADVGLLDDPAANDELRIYGAEVLPSGMIRYTAPEGAHDDTVIARMLAYDAIGDDIGDPVILDW